MTLKYELTLREEVERVLFEAHRDHHQQDHAECAEHLRDRVTQQDVVPRELLLQVALDSRLRIGQGVENDAHANVQNQDQLYREHVA